MAAHQQELSALQGEGVKGAKSAKVRKWEGLKVWQRALCADVAGFRWTAMLSQRWTWSGGHSVATLLEQPFEEPTASGVAAGPDYRVV